MYALVTLNVFQNSLRDYDDPSWWYYTDLLSRLLSKPVRWYMTKPDYDNAWSYFDQFGQKLCEMSERAYLNMLNRVQVCLIDEGIIQDAGRNYQFSLWDCIRLECAVNYALDAIVTYEPHHFCLEDALTLQIKGYFPFRIPTECVDTGYVFDHKVMVFSVTSFLLYCGGPTG